MNAVFLARRNGKDYTKPTNNLQGESMAWIKIDISLARHPKVIRFAKELGIPPREAKHLLIDFWGWCREFAESGFIGKLEPKEIMDGIDFLGPPETFVQGLIAARLIKDGWINDWAEWGGAEVANRITKNPKTYERKYIEMCRTYSINGHSRAQVRSDREKEKKETGNRESDDFADAGLPSQTVFSVTEEYLRLLRERGHNV